MYDPQTWRMNNAVNRILQYLKGSPGKRIFCSLIMDILMWKDSLTQTRLEVLMKENLHQGIVYSSMRILLAGEARSKVWWLDLRTAEAEFRSLGICELIY
jgi:hypothetical protein